MKEKILAIVDSWKRDDDADDYFEMWANALNISPENISKKDIDTKINNKIFSILSYNMFTELQKIKDFFYLSTSISSLKFCEIRKKLYDYKFLYSLTEKINEFGTTESDKKILLYSILKNLLNIYILLTENIYNGIVFKQIGEIGYNKLYRSWRREDQLISMKKKSKFYDQINSELIIDNYLSSSIDKNLALQFYKNASGGIKYFTLWEVEVPNTYPYLHVSDELKEILIHIGSKLRYIGYEDNTYGDFTYRMEKYIWVGFCKNTTIEVINKYKQIIYNIKKYIKYI